MIPGEFSVIEPPPPRWLRRLFGLASKKSQADLNDCPECGNGYLTVRTDIYKGGREFVYCDCCGCLADRRVWNRIAG